MNLRHTERRPTRPTARAGLALLLVAAFSLGACSKAPTAPAKVTFPSAPSGSLAISYPLDETLFPPEIVAPTFVWKDESPGVANWVVMVRLQGSSEVLQFPTTAPRWRPSEADWARIKQQSVEQ